MRRCGQLVCTASSSSIISIAMRKFLFLMLLLLCGCMLSCMDEEKFDTPAGATLDFSIDTLKFDTVLANVGTPTRYFMAYNHNKKGIRITDISFENGESRGFRVNADGLYINNGLQQPIERRKGDSLRIFVELTPEAYDRDEPVEVSARLIFTLANGMRQSVVLTAFSQNVNVMRNIHVMRDSILASGRPYLIYDSLTVAEGATLTLQAGAMLYFHSNAGLRVDGSLKAEGTLKQQIVFRGDRTDMMFENQPYDRVPNQWQGIRFTSSSYGNELNYCDIHSGNYGIVCDSSDASREKLRMENSVVHNMGGNCITLFSTNAFVGNTQITNAANYCIAVYGGNADFVHCTIANCYPFEARRDGALYYSNEFNGQPYPIEKLSVRNSIITGYSDDEIYGVKSEAYPKAAFNYGFYNSLLDTPEVDDEQIVGCKWDNSKNKVCREGNFPKFNNAALIYSFKLVKESPAVGLGDETVTSIYYPNDRLGRPRLADGHSDAGCYEFQETAR